MSEGGKTLPNANPDYVRALELSLLFFEAQRSGYLPSNQRVIWRGDSGINDGQDQNLPMAFTIPTLAWSVIEYGVELENLGQLGHALGSIKWGTDYFMKAHPSPSVLWSEDELLWVAFWLFEATGHQTYLTYRTDNAQELGGTLWSMTQFGWDVKYSGLQMFASKILLEGEGGEHIDTLKAYQSQASYFLCACLNKNSEENVKRSPEGLLWIQYWNNVQFVTSAAFLLTVYTDRLTAANQKINCPDQAPVQTTELLTPAQGQINYILGNNPRGTSYMVGFTHNSPQEVHHRGASIVSIHSDSSPVECREGYAQWYKKPEENPNLLLGAVVGGPDVNDKLADQRDNFEITEACLYNNGPLVGVLARLNRGDHITSLLLASTTEENSATQTDPRVGARVATNNYVGGREDNLSSMGRYLDTNYGPYLALVQI